ARAASRASIRSEGSPAAANRCACCVSAPSDRIEALLAARAKARKAKDFATADGIRTMLTAAGVEVRDGQTPPYVLTDSFDAAKLEATA
ncbi:MAG: hypothetical protein AAFP23_07165, partial [Pseudomonadota bacterium]